MLDLPLLGGPVTTHLIGKGPAMAGQENKASQTNCASQKDQQMNVLIV